MTVNEYEARTVESARVNLEGYIYRHAIRQSMINNRVQNLGEGFFITGTCVGLS